MPRRYKEELSTASKNEIARFESEVYFTDSDVETFDISSVSPENIPEVIRNLNGEFVLIKSKYDWYDSGEAYFKESLDTYYPGPGILLKKTDDTPVILDDILSTIQIARRKNIAPDEGFAWFGYTKCHPAYDYNYPFVMLHQKYMKQLYGEQYRYLRKIFHFTVNNAFDAVVSPMEIRSLNGNSVLVYMTDGKIIGGYGYYNKKTGMLDVLATILEHYDAWNYRQVSIRESDIISIYIEETAEYVKNNRDTVQKNRYDLELHPSKVIIQQFKETAREEGGRAVSLYEPTVTQWTAPDELKNLNGNNVLIFTKTGKLLKGKGLYKNTAIAGEDPAIVIFCGGETRVAVMPIDRISLIYIEINPNKVIEKAKAFEIYNKYMNNFLEEWKNNKKASPNDVVQRYGTLTEKEEKEMKAIFDIYEETISEKSNNNSVKTTGLAKDVLRQVEKNFPEPNK